VHQVGFSLHDSVGSFIWTDISVQFNVGRQYQLLDG